ncbi:MAG: dTMP kinase [Thermoplasmataceae archaeon]
MFIAIEGIDGAGKSTLAKTLEKSLSSSKFKVYLTYEPTEKFTENLSLLEKTGRNDPLILLAMFIKDRINHVAFIEEKIREGFIVICDRFSLSTFAYQGALLKDLFRDEESWIKWMESTLSIIQLIPDLTIYLDLKPQDFEGRKKKENHYEMFEDKAYLDSVYSAYRKAIEYGILSRNFHVCDASMDKNSVLECALSGLKSKLGLNV